MKPNIYTIVVFDLHPKVSEILTDLNTNGQIDLDDDGHPYLIKSEKTGGNLVTTIMRNGVEVSFIVSPRKKNAGTIFNWNQNDGFKREEKVIKTDSTKERKRNLNWGF